MRDILVHVRNHASWADCESYAANLAARINGTLTGVYIEPSPLALTPPYVAVAGDVIAAACEAVRDDESRAVKAADRFLAWSTSMGVARSAWQVVEGDVPTSLARLSNWHDLLVLQRVPDDPIASTRELGATALASAAPCIIVPRHKHEARLDHIALAWNHSDAAIRAIHAARPLLAHAKRITLFERTRPMDENDRGWFPPFTLDRYFDRQGIKVDREMFDAADGEAGEQLLAAARKCRADLLVMGAYGRSRFSERMLGGATRSALLDAPLPVFLKH